MSCITCNKTSVTTSSKLKLLGTNACVTNCSTTFDACNFVQGSYFIVSVSVYRDEATFQYYIDQIVLSADTNYVTSITSFPSLITLTDPLSGSHIFSHIADGLYQYQGTDSRLEITSDMTGSWTLLANNLAFTLVSGLECCISVTFTFDLTVAFETPNVYAIDDSYILDSETDTLCMSITDNDIIEGGVDYTITIQQPPAKGSAVVDATVSPPTICYTRYDSECGQDALLYQIETVDGAKDTAVVGVYLQCGNACLTSDEIRYSESVDTRRYTSGDDNGELYIYQMRWRPSVPTGITFSNYGAVSFYDSQGGLKGTYSATAVINGLVYYTPDANNGESDIIYDGESWTWRITGLAVVMSDNTTECQDLTSTGTFIDDICKQISFPPYSVWMTSAYIEDIPGNTAGQVNFVFSVGTYTNYNLYISTNPNDRTELTAVTNGSNTVTVSEDDLNNGLIWFYMERVGQEGVCFEWQEIDANDIEDTTSSLSTDFYAVSKYRDLQNEGLGVNLWTVISDPSQSHTVATITWTFNFAAADTLSTTSTLEISGLGLIASPITHNILNTNGQTIESFTITGSYDSLNIQKTVDSSLEVIVQAVSQATDSDGITSELSNAVSFPMQVIL